MLAEGKGYTGRGNEEVEASRGKGAKRKGKNKWKARGVKREQGERVNEDVFGVS